MLYLSPPLLAQGQMNEVLAALALTFWLAVAVLGGMAMVFRYRRKVRERELGAEMVRDMLARKMSVDEIERVLVAWGGRRSLLKELMQVETKDQPPLGKPVQCSAG